MFESVQDAIYPFGRQMPSPLAYLLCDLVDVACCMRKIQNTECIVPMTVHKPLDPLRPILDGTHLLGSLNASSAHFRARLISKGGGRGHARKVREPARYDLFFLLVLAAFDRANGHQLHGRPTPLSPTAPSLRRYSSPCVPPLAPQDSKP